MKRTAIIGALCLVAVWLPAQNIQLHYDFRGTLDGEALTDDGYPLNERDFLTATFEWLQQDRYGETFLFVDFDFSRSGGNLGLIYAEISRKINLGRSPVQAIVEFDGGIGEGFVVPNAYLAGFSYSVMAGPVYLNAYLAYKLNHFHRLSHDVQWTGVWHAPFFRDRFACDGFVDLWSENHDRKRGCGGKGFRLMAEPQLWYNILPCFAVGTEVELTYGFYNECRFKVYPTLAVKYTFGK